MMRFSIVGYGRVGSAFSRALSSVGFECVSIVSSKSRSEIDVVPTGVFRNVSDVATFGDLCLICVSDDHIEEVSKALALRRETLEDTIFVHTSGALSSQVLDALSCRNNITASFHPMQSFPPGAGKEIFKDIYFGLEGDVRSFELLEHVASALEAKVKKLTSEEKAILHLGGVFVSNFLSALTLTASSVISEKGIGDDRFVREYYAPLIRKTIENIIEKGFPQALTGPAVRGDEATIKTHLSLLENPEHVQLYKSLSRVLLEVSKQHKMIEPARFEELKRHLQI